MAETGTVHPIVYYGDPILHRPCQKITEFDEKLKQLIDDMFASMYAADGVGLAANQIGVDASVFVMDITGDDGKQVVAHVVNPTLLPAEPPRRLEADSEGCLSVPGQYTTVPRVDSATVTGFDMNGEPITISGTGYVARCLQHETDHLQGLVFVDRLPRRMRKKLLEGAGLPTDKPRP
ncbi:peptide deformylase [Stackebrandtia soli]|uniref:peptide deformylase n=1 Tax=Stackebrandtia soli TaxID=1892856 RepID=UPI0039ED0333